MSARAERAIVMLGLVVNSAIVSNVRSKWFGVSPFYEPSLLIWDLFTVIKERLVEVRNEHTVTVANVNVWMDGAAKSVIAQHPEHLV